MTNYKIYTPDGVALDPDSVFVISRHDLLGPQVLYEYAHLIMTALELDSLPGRTCFTNDERVALQIRSDLVIDIAQKWMSHRKEVVA